MYRKITYDGSLTEVQDYHFILNYSFYSCPIWHGQMKPEGFLCCSEGGRLSTQGRCQGKGKQIRKKKEVEENVYH